VWSHQRARKKYRGPCVLILWIDGPKKAAKEYFIKKLSTGKKLSDQVNPKNDVELLLNRI
jgi:hypothetical protein